MIITILVLLATVAMFIIGKIRADIVALCALTILILCGILSPAEALSGFSNLVVVMGDYVKVGLPLQIIMGIVMTIVLPLPFPL